MSIKKIKNQLSTLSAFQKVETWRSGEEISVLQLKGFVGSVASFLFEFMLKDATKKLVCLVPEEENAQHLTSDLLQINGENAPILYLPQSNAKPYDIEQVEDVEQAGQRVEALLSLQQEFPQILVVSIASLYEKVPHKKMLEENTLELVLGDNAGPDILTEFFVDQGFEIVSFVSQPGEMARRGGILDLYPFIGQYPYRLEFFGDELDSIREFDPLSQRSISTLTRIVITPHHKQQSKKYEKQSVFNLIPSDATFCILNSMVVQEVLEQLYQKAEKQYERNKEVLQPYQRIENEFLSPEEIRATLRTFKQIHYGSFSNEDSSQTVMLKSFPQPDFGGRIPQLRKQINHNASKGIDTYILCDSQGQEVRLLELLVEEVEQGQCQLIIDPLETGFEIPELKLAVYTDHQIFNRYYRPTHRKNKRKFGGLSLRSLKSLQIGDYVTHIDYGIGQFAGLQTIEVRGKHQEVVKLLYRDNDILYVNVGSLYKLHKYKGKEGFQARLTKLGTSEWERNKSKTKRRVKDIARELIKLYATRKASKGYAFPKDTIWQNELEASFEFEDTPDQAKACIEVKQDMEQPIPMDRLVCGDVGFGKTEVAVRAAFKAVQEGKQVAVLVPTTILASQHYKTFKERLANFPVHIDVVSRFRTTKEQKETFEKLEQGSLDIIIGTHRLASKNVKFKNLGLLIIDEEQRFGVAVKERLRQMRAHIDTLTLTATPIPRTLQFSLMGARDLSIINTAPPNRQPIITEIHTFDKNLIRDAILYEVGRGGQVFFIHNRVKSILEMAQTLRLLLPNIRINVGHGQMAADELEKVMMDFIDKKFDVLISTNIVESGLDISNANTMIINHAERFGLAELHQLRGRVGRSDRKAFCYLLVPTIHTLTKEAKQRLQAIEEFSELGSGLNLAMRDLDIRGAGNLLGAEQSGFITEVGFEAYHRILDEAIQELRTEEFTEVFDTEHIPPPLSEIQIDIDDDALIPENYVSDRIERLNLYRTLSEVSSQEMLVEVRKEWQDRFGKIPKEAENLLLNVEIKLAFQPFRFAKVQYKNQRLFISFPPAEDTYFYDNYFHPILEKLHTLENKFVLKDENNRLKAIVQNVKSIQEILPIAEHVAVTISKEVV